MNDEPYNLIERHTSPDGVLDLVVFDGDGDWTAGFVPPGADATKAGPWQWHTHGDLLVHEYGGTPESAMRRFIDDVLSSKRVIVISRVDRAIQSVWVTDDPDLDESKYIEPNETIEKRFWNGTWYGR